MIDTLLVLKGALAGFLVGGAILLVMALPVQDPASDFAREKKLLDPLGPVGIPSTTSSSTLPRQHIGAAAASSPC